MTLKLEQIIREGSLEDLKSRYGDNAVRIIGDSRKHSLIGSDVVTRSGGKETYPSNKFVFRELIQNCQRGYIDLHNYLKEKSISEDEKEIIRKRPVNIWFKRNISGDNEIHVVDFGYGITKENLEFFIGLKRGKDAMTDKYASWFGMGTFSADLISKYMIVETTIPESNVLLIGSINFDFIRENEQKKGEDDYIEHPDGLLEKACAMYKIKNGTKKHEHFTHVIMFIKEDYDPFEQLDEIKKFIADSCPVHYPSWTIEKENGSKIDLKKIAEEVRSINPLAKYPLSVYVNGDEVVKRYSHTELYDIENPVYGDGDLIYVGSFKFKEKEGTLLLAKYWYVISGKRGQKGPSVIKNNNNIIGVYVDGFLWDDPDRKKFLMDLATNARGGNETVNRNYLGEIHIRSNNFVNPNQARTEIASGRYYDKQKGQLKDQFSNFIDELGTQREDIMDIENFRRQDLDGLRDNINNLDDSVKRPITCREEVEKLLQDYDTVLWNYNNNLGAKQGSIIRESGQRKKKLRRQFELIPSDLEEIDNQTTIILENIKKTIDELEKKYPKPTSSTSNSEKASQPTSDNNRQSDSQELSSRTTVDQTSSNSSQATSKGWKWHIIITKNELESLIKQFINRKKLRNRFLEKLDRFVTRREEINE